MSFSQEDLEALAKIIHGKSEGAAPSFFIPPEEHYNYHKNLNEMYTDWKTIKDTFMKVILGFAIVGTIVVVCVGAAFEFFRDIPSKLGH